MIHTTCTIYKTQVDSGRLRLTWAHLHFSPWGNSCARMYKMKKEHWSKVTRRGPLSQAVCKQTHQLEPLTFPKSGCSRTVAEVLTLGGPIKGTISLNCLKRMDRLRMMDGISTLFPKITSRQRLVMFLDPFGMFGRHNKLQLQPQLSLALPHGIIQLKIRKIKILLVDGFVWK